MMSSHGPLTPSSSRDDLRAYVDLEMGMYESMLVGNNPDRGSVPVPVPSVKRPDSAVLPDLMVAQPGNAKKINRGTGI